MNGVPVEIDAIKLERDDAKLLSTCKAYTVEVKHNIDRVHRSGLIPDLHTTKDACIQEAREPLLRLYTP